jgi:exo-beta-1,3-glucanase (GH17 family)
LKLFQNFSDHSDYPVLKKTVLELTTAVPSCFAAVGTPIPASSSYLASCENNSGGKRMRNRLFQIPLAACLFFIFNIFSVMAAFPPCEGDFDGDLDVDGADSALFASDLNRTDCNGDCHGDFYNDGDVDALDLEIFSADFSRTECTPVTYKLHGLNFSPYMDGQDPNLLSFISEEQLFQRVRIITPYTQWIRSFGSTHGLEETARIAREFNHKVAAGAWLSSDLSANALEMQNLIAAARNGQVDIAIVGSEVLLVGGLTEGQLLDYINQFKNAVPNVPVTTAEVYSVLLSHPAVISACDLIFVNYYPYWEGIDVNKAVAHLHAQHQEMVAKAGGKEVVVSETGWPSAGDQIGEAVPSLENSCFFLLNFVSWARTEEVSYFIFEAFDESWKALYEGPQGAHWGMWYKDGNLKECMEDIFKGITIEDNWTCQEMPGGLGTPEIEFTYVPPYGSFDNLQGQVWHVAPADYKVAVYIRVGTGWWTKPSFASPLTDIYCQGNWICDITTGGIDEQANTIAAFLVPKDYYPPAAAGISTLPAELTDNAVAYVEVTRLP